MDAARYARLSAWFEQARGLDVRARAALLERVSREDAELGHELALLYANLEPAPDAELADARALLFEPAIGAARASLEELAQAPDAADRIPARIGSYRILRRIGQGGMGVVYEAEQSAPQRRVALKMIPPSSGGAERLRRFKLEGELLGRLHHPNIAQVFECGTADLGHGPQPFFAMEFVEGVDLYSFALRANLGIDAKLALVARVADAVQHAHERGVVHRDLKPDNVLVEASGEPKVLDFGVARASDTSSVATSTRTQTGELVGTLAYMAPEQLSGSRGKVGPQVDVYALGVILYQLLAARLPHDVAGLPLTAAMQMLAHAEPLPLTQHDPRCAGDVATIVAKAMEKDPERRYASAAELAADLRRHLEHLPIAARPASASYRLRKAIRRNRGLVTGMVAVFVTLTAGLAGTLWQAHASDANADRALRQAYSANMLLADGALGRAQLAAARIDLEAAPESLRGWEWRVLAARLDASARKHARGGPGSSYDWLNRLELIPARDGAYLTIDSLRGRPVRRWSRSTGELLAEYPHADPGAHVTTTALSPDGQLLRRASWSVEHDVERVPLLEWNLSTGELRTSVLPLPRTPITDWRGAFPSPDGSLWIATTQGVRVWDGSSEGTVSVGRTEGIIDMIDFNHDGSLVALFDGSSLRVLDGKTHAVASVAAGHASRVIGVSFSPDGRKLATGSSDGTARVWNLASPSAACLMTMPHGTDVVTVAFDPGAKRLATLSFDRNIRIWNVANGALLETLGTETLCSTALAFFSENEVAGLETNGSLVTWDLDAKATQVLEGHRNPLRGAVPLSSTGLIASGAWDGFDGRIGALRLWDAETGEAVAACLGVEQIVYALACGTDGETLAISVRDDKSSPSAHLFLVNTRNGRVSRVPLVSSAPISLALDPSGVRLALANETGALILDLASPGTPARITLPIVKAEWSHGGELFAFACRPNDAAGDGGTVLFDARSLAELRRFPSGRTLAVAFSPDDRRIATAGEDAFVRLWDVADGTLIATLTGHDLEILALAFSPDGRRLASGGLDQVIRLWDTDGLAPVGALSGHTDHVASLAWDGERLISSSGDDTVRIWEPEPVRTRLAAREARRAAVARVAPIVTRLLAEHDTPEAVLSALAQETGLDTFERKVAHQLALGAALERALK